MARGKLKMEIIKNQKSRNLTFKKRKEGLKKKLQELTTLCDVSACMIISAPKQDQNGGGAGATEPPDIWPQDPDQVRRIIELYRSKNRDSCTKTFGLPDFLQERKKKVDRELAERRKKNVQTKYSTNLPEFLHMFTEAQLREFRAALEKKAKLVKSRIELLKRIAEQQLDMMNLIENEPLLDDFYCSNHHQEIASWNHDHQQEIASLNDPCTSSCSASGNDFKSLEQYFDPNFKSLEQYFDPNFESLEQCCDPSPIILDQYYVDPSAIMPQYYVGPALSLPEIMLSGVAMPESQFWEDLHIHGGLWCDL